MAIFYLNPQASGLNNGSNETDAWTSLQAAIDGDNGVQPSPGDTVLMNGSEVVTTTINWDGASGTNGSFISWIGVNSSWIEDGTRYFLNGLDNSINILRIWAVDSISLKHLEIANTLGATSHGILVAAYAGADQWLIENLYIHDCGGDGFSAPGNRGMIDSKYINCKFVGNGGFGIRASGVIAYCKITENGQGLAAAGGADSIVLYASIIAKNAGDGIFNAGWSNPIVAIGCTIDENVGDGIRFGIGFGIAIACRLTNNGVAINTEAITQCVGYSYAPGVGQDRENTVNFSGAGGVLGLTDKTGLATNNWAGVDSGGGYIDAINDDYNITQAATMRRIAIDLDQ